VTGTLGDRPLAFPPVVVAAGVARVVRTTIRLAHPTLWAPGHPALIDLHLEVNGEAGWSERVGLRELRWSGGRLRINGRRLLLHGASLQEDAQGRGDALTAADMDVWGSGLPPDTSALLYRHVDVIGVTLYEGWYQRPGEPLASVASNLRRRLAGVHAIFGSRPLVVSEFGAEANGLNPPAAPGGPGYQARLLGREIRIFRADRRLDGWLGVVAAGLRPDPEVRRWLDPPGASPSAPSAGRQPEGPVGRAKPAVAVCGRCRADEARRAGGPVMLVVSRRGRDRRARGRSRGGAGT
jgi:hypothetical protein